ncbi:hypothetical protein EX30DRAFT_347041 [Ascodesmis nigricans]|uniref:Phospholipid metabolism enzyme regulator n=1 Tax=Ascodesmis nigricans TaxID=341454 RepID=A0A4S2N560_9PEZI|nr:hypothetical protein EX30DRAFT_347041 [Ascodesmis nigricans]
MSNQPADHRDLAAADGSGGESSSTTNMNSRARRIAPASAARDPSITTGNPGSTSSSSARAPAPVRVKRKGAPGVAAVQSTLGISREPSPNGAYRHAPHLPAGKSSSSLSELDSSYSRNLRPVADGTGQRNRQFLPGTSPSGLNKPGPSRTHKRAVETPLTTSSPAPPPTPSAPVEDQSETDDNDMQPGMKTPRNHSGLGLETVRESSLPTTPAIGTSKSLHDSVAALHQRQMGTPPQPIQFSAYSRNDSFGGRDTRANSVASSIAASTQESESEGYRSEDRTPTGSVHRSVPPVKGFARRPTVLGKESSSRGGMTVETETVSAIPHAGLGSVVGAGGHSIRSKKSTDTIRAPREKKKKRRAPPTNPNPTSKADIFAARIAEAVDEANSSDSEETFVYESNPPEPSQRPTSRFHSRTPSATSLGGPDPRALRLPLLNHVDGALGSGRRKDMKFVSNTLNKEVSTAGEASGEGSSERGGRSRDHRDRNSRQNGHRSILNDENPFHHRQSNHKPSTTSLRHQASSMASSRGPSQPSSPKMPPYTRTNNTGLLSKKSSRVWASYEADVEGGDDDEMTPLVRRQPRRGYPRSASLRQQEYTLRRRGWAKGYISCIVLITAIAMVVAGLATFFITTNNALQDVKIVNITDVLVSKQEIMLDLVVRAVNPNFLSVTVADMDINIFAKSSHLRDGEKDGDDKDPKDPPKKPPGAEDPWVMSSPSPSPPASRFQLSSRPPYWIPPPTYSTTDTVDDGTSPPEDTPENDRETMLLGRVMHFDSVLTFDGTPFSRFPTESIGEFRLQKPGNATEEGGTERWERVLQHPFELIVRGILKYSMPLSGRSRTATVSAKVQVKPGEDGTGSVGPKMVLEVEEI